MQNNKSKLWNVHYINTLMVSMLINITGNILVTVLPLYAVSLGSGNMVAGLLLTILTIAALLCRPLIGKMLDITGRRAVLLLGLCLFSLSTILLISSSNMFLLFTLRCFQGIGLSAFSTALGTILSDIVPEQRISEGVGYFGISITISMAVGPMLGLYLCSRFGYQITYIIAFGISICSIIFASFINYEVKTGKCIDKKLLDTDVILRTAAMGKNETSKGFIEKSSIRPCIVMLFIVFAISAVFSFMPIFSETRNIDNIGLFFTVYAGSMILSRPLIDKASDRFGHMKVFLPGIAIIFILFLTLAFAYSLPAVLLAAVFYGVGYGIVQPIMNAIVIKLSPPERRGAANATYYATFDIGFGMGSFVWGAVSQFAGFTVVFLSCAFCIALSFLAYYLILRRTLVENGLEIN